MDGSCSDCRMRCVLMTSHRGEWLVYFSEELTVAIFRVMGPGDDLVLVTDSHEFETEGYLFEVRTQAKLFGQWCGRSLFPTHVAYM
jgi:hypothetical protein